ncbi:complex I NDUFA9 subunit family protein [Geomonas sp. Red32]|uniref:complex I NDUFA9 subunit family protein n=1 Tax=Geomonas sp. Red32 TaxID=2912856 RepID=UPI00202CEB50|nr:complex I NDUFA9 subunit family protein [Geomonas sp. Red32]MCM0083966.1 complex I NDUFA9 subunit family protein [Geomonas sp. Red32]
MLIFLAGGTGFVGGHVRQALLAKGHTIRLLVHRRSGGSEPGVEEVEGDATIASSVAAAAKGCEATINLIGIIREFPGKGVTFQKLHIEATHNVIAAARDNGIRRHLQMSALGTRAGSSAKYFQTKFAAEEAVRNSGLDYTIFRPSVVFGPKDDFINMLAKMLRTFPAVPVIGDGEYQMQPISADDVARCFADSLDKPVTVRQTYELCGPDRMTYNELLDTIGRVLGMKKVLKINNPVTLMKLIVPFMEKVPAFPLTSDQLTMLLQGSCCDGSWRETFGFTPVPFEEGIRRYLTT